MLLLATLKIDEFEPETIHRRIVLELASYEDVREEEIILDTMGQGICINKCGNLALYPYPADNDFCTPIIYNAYREDAPEFIGQFGNPDDVDPDNIRLAYILRHGRHYMPYVRTEDLKSDNDLYWQAARNMQKLQDVIREKNLDESLNCYHVSKRF